MRRFVIVMLFISLVIGGLVSWFASTAPDGLERVAEDSGFIGQEEEPMMKLMPDYTVPGLGAFLSNTLAGLIGVSVTFAAVWLGTRFLARRNDRN